MGNRCWKALVRGSKLSNQEIPRLDGEGRSRFSAWAPPSAPWTPLVGGGKVQEVRGFENPVGQRLR